MINLVEKYRKTLLKISIIYLSFILLLILLVFKKHFNINYIYFITSEECQQIFILGISLDNWCTIITIASIVAGAYWAVHQYNKSIILRQQEKATIVAQSFSEKLTLKCTLICSVIENSPLENLLKLKEFDCFCFSNFNTNEIRQVYKDDDFIEKYTNLKSFSELDIIYYNLLESKVSTMTFSEIVKKHNKYTTHQARKLFILDNEGLPFSFNSLVSDVLNELEYLCMGLASHVAGSAFVYQSLHQVFLRTIRVLAVEIALSNNTYYSDKFYTNIIEVYNNWKSLYSLDLKSEKALKKKIDKMLNPKIKKV